jgi:hypothetical protein
MKADDEAPENSQRAASVLVRINARAWGVATGALLGVGLFLATLVLLWKGGSDVGAHLGRLSYVLPGYDVSYAGAFLGLIYGFFIGYALGRVLGPKRDLSSTDAADSGPIHVRLAPRSWGFTLGVLMALVLFAMANVLFLRGGSDVGSLLRHLHIYLPGYSVDFIGSLIGGAYMLALGWIVGQAIAQIYNRAVTRAEA